MKPRSEAIAFRIWQFCEPRGWDVTIEQVGEALDLSPRSVRSIVGMKGWQNRLRATLKDHQSTTELRGLPMWGASA